MIEKDEIELNSDVSKSDRGGFILTQLDKDQFDLRMRYLKMITKPILVLGKFNFGNLKNHGKGEHPNFKLFDNV